MPSIVYVMPRLYLLKHNVSQVDAHAHWACRTMENVEKNSKIWVTSKRCNGQTVSRTKTFGERAHR